MQAIGALFIVIACLIIHHLYAPGHLAPINKRKCSQYSINEWLLKPELQNIDDTVEESPPLLTVNEIRNVLIDARMLSKAEPTVDDNREEL